MNLLVVGGANSNSALALSETKERASTSKTRRVAGRNPDAALLTLTEEEVANVVDTAVDRLSIISISINTAVVDMMLVVPKQKRKRKKTRSDGNFAVQFGHSAFTTNI